MELIKHLREEAERLSAHSLDRGAQEAGIAANLASQAADALEQMEAVMTRLSDMSVDVAVHLTGDERRAFGRIVNDADVIIGRTYLPPMSVA